MLLGGGDRLHVVKAPGGEEAGGGPPAEAREAKAARSCTWWFSSDPATYMPMMRRMDSASLRLLHQEKVVEGVGFAHESQAPFWRIFIAGCCIEASLCFAIQWLQQSWTPWACFLAWVNVRGFLYNAGNCLSFCTRQHAQLLATLASLVPFSWLLPWAASLILSRCTCHEVLAHMLGNEHFWHYQLSCPNSFNVGKVRFFLDPTSSVAAVISVGIPLFYMYIVFVSGTQLVRLKVFDKMWKLQVLSLDVFDICALVTQVYNPDAFRFFHASQPFAILVLSFTPVMFLSVLYETARELKLLERYDRKEAPHIGSIVNLITLTLPMLLIRVGILVQGVSVTQAVWILKNVISGLSHIMIAATGVEDNFISLSLRKMAGMLAGNEALKEVGFADVYADTSSELREKVAMLTKLVDGHGQALQRLTFQRALLGAQANIFEGVEDLNMKALMEGFCTFDVNRDYKLSREELKTMMMTVSKYISEAEIDRIMANADLNGDGMIDYREFSERLILDPEVRTKVLGSVGRRAGSASSPTGGRGPNSGGAP